ncbi:MAG TPA: trypsin-like peptidase domain-containing protein [Kineosporiaceae bacterium]
MSARVIAAHAGGRRPGSLTRAARGHHRHRILGAALLAVACVILSPAQRSQAVLDGLPARGNAAQVRLFENGNFRGGGTLVGRNWVITAAHVIEDSDNPTASSLRFGVINDQADDADRTNLRTIDRIVRHGQLDLALVHFSDPVPDDTWIPRLADQGPSYLQRAVMYGWAPAGHSLNRIVTLVLNSAASANINLLRSMSSEVAANFSGDPRFPPLVVNGEADPGDSGSGLFNESNALVGVLYGGLPYRQESTSGSLYGDTYDADYQFPVWRVRSWIQSVMSGEGTSGTKPTTGGPPRRRLPAGSGALSMSMPPQLGVCDPGHASCTTPGPHFVPAAVLGSGNYRGTALARCASAPGNGCSFDGTRYAAGGIARMRLGPSSGAPGPRGVVVWCTTTTVFPGDGDPARHVLRISFTNADDVQGPVGMGWWDVTPDQLGTGANQSPVDTGQLATC